VVVRGRQRPVLTRNSSECRTFRLPLSFAESVGLTSAPRHVHSEDQVRAGQGWSSIGSDCTKMSCMMHFLEYDKYAVVRVYRIYEERPGNIDAVNGLTPSKLLCPHQFTPIYCATMTAMTVFRGTWSRRHRILASALFQPAPSFGFRWRQAKCRK